MQIVVDKLLANYELSGKGRLVLLLHGWGDSSVGLRDLQSKLAKSYRVLVIDLPGFGSSQAPKAVWDLDDYAHFLRALLDKLGLKQPYALIGHSNGGALAIRAVSLQILKPKKLILLAASGIRNDQKVKRLVLKIIAKTGDIATIWMPERYRRALRKSLYGVAGSDMLVMPGLKETFKKTVRQDVQSDAANITIPTLLIYAANDRAVPPNHGHRYQKLIKNSHLEVVSKSEHFLHLDQPDRVEQLIEEFLK